MNPIGPKITPNITPPVSTPATGQSAPADATKKFDLGGVSAPQQAAQTQAMARPSFDRIRALLVDPANQSMSREQLRDKVIQSETKHMFGDQATPEMAASVSEAFADDPHLSQLFNRLVSESSK